MGPMLYHMELSVGGQQFIGRGRTRQLAKHDAAAKALKMLHKEPILQQLPVVRDSLLKGPVWCTVVPKALFCSTVVLKAQSVVLSY